MSWFRAKLAKAAKGRMSRSFAPFVSFARHLLITMDTHVLVSREVSEGSEGKNVSILRSLRLLRATPPHHHGHPCPRFARSQRRQRREECPRSFAPFAPFVSFARHLLITMDTYLLVSREVSE